MSDYTEFFLATPTSVSKLELFEIAHPDFTKTYSICRNHLRGVTVTLEDSTSRLFGFYPVSIKPLGVNDDLEQGFSVTIGDAGDTLSRELEAIALADAFDTYPTFRYWAYRSDVLTAPLEGPFTLQITDVSKNDEGFSFEARAPGLNLSKTGELYRIDRFPMMRGLL